MTAFIVAVDGRRVDYRLVPSGEACTFEGDHDGATAGSLVEMETDGDLFLCEHPVVAEILTGLRWQAGPKRYAIGNRHLQGHDLLRDHVGDQRVAELAARNLELLLVNGDTAHARTTWLYHGGLEGWLTDCGIGAVAVAIKERQAEVERARHRSEQNDVFVNPYTFVPLPRSVSRHEPAWHHRLDEGRFGVRLRVELEALTPLLIRSGPREAMSIPERGGRPILPGSSLKGAVRSLHEALTGSCLRIFDGAFVPVYREQAQPRPPGWHPMVVRAVDPSGRPTTVETCSAHVWAEAPIVHAAVAPQDLRTGSLVAVDEALIVDGPHRRREVGTGGVSPGRGWVVIVSDSKARRSGHPYSCALGRLSGTTAEVHDDTWKRYLAAAEGADDIRVADADGDTAKRTLDTRVVFDDQLIGTRQPAARRCSPGDVFWGRVAKELVTDLALSVIWRSKGKHAALERLPPPASSTGSSTSALPCQDEASLCPSCRIFGSAGDDAKRTTAEQHSYRGHVRIGDAVAGPDIVVEKRPLPPMGAPRPGAGQFYLRQRADGPKRAAGPIDRPVREWGSAADQPTVRQLAGRKFYWHADPEEQQKGRGRRRDVARAHQLASPQVTEVEVIKAGARFAVDVVAEGLDTVELGSLIVTFEPHRALARHVPDGWRPTDDGDPTKGLALRLGGGKPLGLGSVRATVEVRDLWTAASRYGTADPPPRSEATVESWVDAFVGQVPPEVKQTWPHLAAALRIGHVNPATVWYPPAGPWNQPDELFEAGAMNFPAFWRNSSGSHGAHHDLLPLPEADAVDQYLPIKGY